VLLVRLSSLGDVVHALPVAHALRRWWPRAELTWVVERREQAILAGHPDLDHVVPVDTRLWRREWRRPAGAREVVLKARGLARRLAGGRFDVAVDLQGLWKSGVITWLSRAPLRLGFDAAHCRERGNALFTTLRLPPAPGTAHVVDANLSLLRGLGVAEPVWREARFPLGPFPEAEASVRDLLAGEGVKADAALVVLNPGSGGEAKRWAIEAYRALGDELAVRLGARVLLAWGPGEEPLARAIAHGMRVPPLIPPPTSLPELVALLRRAALVVGGDTGPVHLAAALGVPTVGLYGPTSARRNGPYGTRSAALQSPTGRMDGIGVPAVLAAVEGLLG
jgi:lipopolysaccharide heptosyltransferase I